MRLAPLALAPLALAASLTLLPARAAAEKAYCSPTQSGRSCGYALDSSDCIVRGGQLYCRTIQFYYWQPIPSE